MGGDLDEWNITEDLLCKVFDQMVKVNPVYDAETPEKRRVTLKQGHQYMLCMGLNPEEWNEQSDFFCDQGRAPGKASQQSGENVWKYKVWEVSMYGTEECKA